MRGMKVVGFAVAGGMLAGAFAACGGGGGSGGGDAGNRDSSVAPDGAVEATPQCQAQGGTAAVTQPTFVRNIKTGETAWYASPAVVDLDKNGSKEIVAPFYSTFVFDAQGNKLSTGKATGGRVYAPGVVADLDGDGTMEVVVGGSDGSTQGTSVAAYEWKGGALSVKAGWPASTCSGGQCPEVRGMAASDLDGDGTIEVVVTTTNISNTGAQVFVFEPNGTVRAGWPRYDQTDDLTFNGEGNQGYGCYGENVGIGNIDDDAQLEILVTYDNHQINAFKADGSSILASDWY
ncbi:MAG TPA: VCBS repeat-containing protein, partial [Polyangiaceae bacterium]|nr:VCBS repeat-containing protein [Polyangiaceae bacterium]